MSKSDDMSVHNARWRIKAEESRFMGRKLMELERDELLVAIGSLLELREREAEMHREFLRPLFGDDKP
jgi:hypothetical protein